jgi:integrase
MSTDSSDNAVVNPPSTAHRVRVIIFRMVARPRRAFLCRGDGLRHSAASLFLASGADISTVSKLLGHSSIAVTADIYAHMLKGVGQRAVDGAAALIPRKVALTMHRQPGVQADAS